MKMISSIRSISLKDPIRMARMKFTSEKSYLGLFSVSHISPNQGPSPQGMKKCNSVSYHDNISLITRYCYTTRSLPSYKIIKSNNNWKETLRNLSISSKIQTTHGEVVKFLTLNNISDNPGAVKIVRIE